MPSSSVSSSARVIAGEASKGLRSSTPVFLLQFLGGLPFVAPQLGDQRDHSGGDAGHQDVGFVAPL